MNKRKQNDLHLFVVISELLLIASLINKNYYYYYYYWNEILANRGKKYRKMGERLEQTYLPCIIRYFWKRLWEKGQVKILKLKLVGWSLDWGLHCSARKTIKGAGLTCLPHLQLFLFCRIKIKMETPERKTWTNSNLCADTEWGDTLKIFLCILW